MLKYKMLLPRTSHLPFHLKLPKVDASGRKEEYPLASHPFQSIRGAFDHRVEGRARASHRGTWSFSSAIPRP